MNLQDQKKPFFAQFLESQGKRNEAAQQQGITWPWIDTHGTHKYPSDSDEIDS